MSIEDQIPRDVFEAISALAYQQAGIVIGPQRKALVAARIGKRLRILGFSQYRQYLNYLESAIGQGSAGKKVYEQELVALLDVMTTNFTHFWREPKHFEILLEDVRTRIKKGQKEFTIWCAAASTGEEPYTLAMIALEALRLENQSLSTIKVRILATDLSTKVLETCRVGYYSMKSMKDLAPEWLGRYWNFADGEIPFRTTHHKGPETLLSANETLRSVLKFARMNLMQTPYAMKGPFDVIFCRNVMIYFDQVGRKTVVDEAKRLLAPGGLFCIGHSESLMGLQDGFSLVISACYKRIK